MEDENLLDDELAGPSRDLDSPATFSKKLILKFGIRHTNMSTIAVNPNNNITNFMTVHLVTCKRSHQNYSIV